MYEQLAMISTRTGEFRIVALKFQKTSTRRDRFPEIDLDAVNDLD